MTWASAWVNIEFPELGSQEDGCISRSVRGRTALHSTIEARRTLPGAVADRPRASTVRVEWPRLEEPDATAGLQEARRAQGP